VCDATQTGQLDALLGSEAFDVIVISMTPAERSDAGYEQAYVQTCRNLVAGLKRHQQQPRLVLFVSSTAVYGQNDGSWVDESSPTQPESFSGNRLLEAEQVIQESGFAHSCVRFSGIYGPGRNRLIEQVKQQRASASPHYTNRIHADDCAGVLAHLIELQHKQDLAPVYLATDSSPTPMVEVVSWIAEQLGIRDFLASDAVNERGNKRISNQRLLASGYSFRYPDFRAGYASLINLQA
jgi:nucleoside-diphosphate-sugar epimerase